MGKVKSEKLGQNASKYNFFHVKDKKGLMQPIEEIGKTRSGRYFSPEKVKQSNEKRKRKNPVKKCSSKQPLPIVDSDEEISFKNVTSTTPEMMDEDQDMNPKKQENVKKPCRKILLDEDSDDEISFKPLDNATISSPSTESVRRNFNGFNDEVREEQEDCSARPKCLKPVENEVNNLLLIFNAIH